MKRGKLPNRLDCKPKRLSEMWVKDGKGKVTVLSDVDIKLRKYRFNVLGSLIWELSNGEITIFEIINAIESMGILNKPARPKFAEDVLNFLDTLVFERLIKLG